MATTMMSRASRVISSSTSVFVRPVEPLLPHGTEDVELERIFEGFCLMRDARRDVQDIALADRDFFPGDEELQRALKHLNHLLAVVRVHRNDTSALDIHLNEHL